MQENSDGGIVDGNKLQKLQIIINKINHNNHNYNKKINIPTTHLVAGLDTVLV
jgi:hypothetical protein